MTNDWEELIRSTTFKFYWVAKCRCKRNKSDLSVDLMARELAEIFWLRVAMPETNKAAIAGKLKHLSPLQHSMWCCDICPPDKCPPDICPPDICLPGQLSP